MQSYSYTSLSSHSDRDFPQVWLHVRYIPIYTNNGTSPRVNKHRKPLWAEHLGLITSQRVMVWSAFTPKKLHRPSLTSAVVVVTSLPTHCKRPTS